MASGYQTIAGAALEAARKEYASVHGKYKRGTTGKAALVVATWKLAHAYLAVYDTYILRTGYGSMCWEKYLEYSKRAQVIATTE